MTMLDNKLRKKKDFFFKSRFKDLKILKNEDWDILLVKNSTVKNDCKNVHGKI